MSYTSMALYNVTEHTDECGGKKASAGVQSYIYLDILEWKASP